VPEESIHPDACWAASVAEAVGEVGGEAAYKKAHVWLIEHTTELFKRDLEAVCQAAGVTASEVSANQSAAEVVEALDEDCRAGTATSLKSIPSVFVNGRWVPRLTRDGEDVMAAILDAARAEAADSN
jgi:protein-disulfide isomerase